MSKMNEMDAMLGSVKEIMCKDGMSFSQGMTALFNAYPSIKSDEIEFLRPYIKEYAQQILANWIGTASLKR